MIRYMFCFRHAALRLHNLQCSLVVSSDRLIVETSGTLVSYIAVEWSLGMNMWVFCVIKICHLSPPCGGGRQFIGVRSHTIMPCIPGKCRINSHTCRFLCPQLKLSTHTKNRCKGLYVVSVCLCACTHAPPTHSAMTIVHISDSVCMCWCVCLPSVSGASVWSVCLCACTHEFPHTQQWH